MTRGAWDWGLEQRRLARVPVASGLGQDSSREVVTSVIPGPIRSLLSQDPLAGQEAYGLGQKCQVTPPQLVQGQGQLGGVLNG